MAPDDFIPLAEDTGPIVPIGDWVLERPCATAGGGPSARRPPTCRMAVNVSPASCAAPASRTSSECCAPTGCPRTRLTLEITERVLLEDRPATLEAALQPGARRALALDDFGTGQSSLSYLSLPFDILKIDRSFVSAIAGGSEGSALVTAMLAMAKSLGLKVVGEGVEEQPQLDFLRARGCDLAQGYLLGRPMAASGLRALLAERKAALPRRGPKLAVATKPPSAPKG